MPLFGGPVIRSGPAFPTPPGHGLRRGWAAAVAWSGRRLEASGGHDAEPWRPWGSQADKRDGQTGRR